MSRGRPLTALERLREQRRSLGDGTLDGRSRLAQPYYMAPRGGRGGFATADVGSGGGVGSQGGAGEIPEGEDTVDVAHLLGVTPETVLVTARVACEVLGVVDEGPSTFTVERCDGYGGAALPFFWRAWPPKLVPPPPLLAVAHVGSGGDPPGMTVINADTKQVVDGWDTGTAEFGAAWHPDSLWLAGGGHTSWNVWTGEGVLDSSNWPSITENPWKLCWSPSGDRVVVPISGEFSGRYTVVDVASKTIESGWPEFGLGQVQKAAFSPDGSRIAFAFTSMSAEPGIDGLAVVDVATKTVESGWPSLAGTGTSVVWSPDGTRLATRNSGSPSLTVVDVATKTVESGWPSLAGSGTSVAFSPDGSRLVTAEGPSNDTRQLAVIDVASKTIESGWPEFPNGLGVMSAVALSPDGSKIAVGASVGSTYGFRSLIVIDVASKTIDLDWPSLTDTQRPFGLAFQGDPGNVTSG